MYLKLFCVETPHLIVYNKLIYEGNILYTLNKKLALLAILSYKNMLRLDFIPQIKSAFEQRNLFEEMLSRAKCESQTM